MFDVNKPKYLNFLLTDVLPYETPILYDINHYYMFLLKSKKLVNVEFNIEAIVPSTPLTFTSYVNSNKIRNMDIICPVTYADIILFIKKYEDVIVDVIRNRNNHSLRYPTSKKVAFRNNSLEKYKIIFNESKDQINRGFVRSYFNIKKYKRPYYYTNSKAFFNSLQRNGYFMHLDISDCFKSIYTHTLKWTDSSYTLYGNNVEKNGFLPAFDKILQYCNGKKTNGIVVGPELSRVAAEVILTKIDEEIVLAASEKYSGEVHEMFEFKRYIDDYYVFAKSDEMLFKIKQIIIECLKKYNFTLNESKIEYKKGIFTYGKFARLIDNSYKFTDINKKFFEKQTLLNFDIAEVEKFDTVLSYYMEVLYKKAYEYLISLKKVCDKLRVSSEKVDEKYLKYFDIDKDENIDLDLIKDLVRHSIIYTFFDEYFFLVNMNPKHSMYNKLVTLITLFDSVLDSIDRGNRLGIYNEWNHTISNIIKKNSKEVLNNIEFSKDLLLIYEKYSVKLNVTNDYVESYLSNPLMLVLLYRYCSSFKNDYSCEIKYITEKVNEKCETLTSNSEIKVNDIFLTKESWYILLFFNSGILKRNIFDNLLSKIENWLGTNKSPKNDRVRILFDYLNYCTKGTGKTVKYIRKSNNGFVSYGNISNVLKPSKVISNNVGSNGY